MNIKIKLLIGACFLTAISFDGLAKGTGQNGELCLTTTDALTMQIWYVKYDPASAKGKFYDVSSFVVGTDEEKNLDANTLNYATGLVGNAIIAKQYNDITRANTLHISLKGAWTGIESSKTLLGNETYVFDLNPKKLKIVPSNGSVGTLTALETTTDMTDDITESSSGSPPLMTFRKLNKEVKLIDCSSAPEVVAIIGSAHHKRPSIK